MSPSPALAGALPPPALWRGHGCAQAPASSVSTGFAELDLHLPDGGWPTGAITELHVERPGIGELQLMMPAAARLTQAGRWQIMIAPPYLPYAPALSAQGVKLSRLVLIRPKTLTEQLWACEQALHSENCGSILLWLDQTSERVPEDALRRLQLSAERRNVLTMLFRASRAPASAQSALRLHVSRETSSTVVRILKRRGGGIPAPVRLDLHSNLLRRPGVAQRDQRDHHDLFGLSPVTQAATTALSTH